MFFASKQLIGLDIGTSSLKLAQVKITRKGTTLTRFSMMSMPPSSISGGEILNLTGISQVIKSLFSEAKVRSKNVATGMWGTAVIVKKISIPQMDGKLIAEQIRWEAEQYIPFDINDISLSHHILEKKNQSGDTMDVLLIAAKKDLVLQYAEVVSEAGYKCKTVDLNGFALANCFEMNFGINSETLALINIGASVTSFVVIKDGDVIFCRDIAVGGENYTSEIHKDMGLSMEEAESLKLSISSGEAVPDEIHPVISATNEMIAEEIQSSFEFFHATEVGEKISRLYFTGGGSLTPGLTDQIILMTGVEGEAFSPLKGLIKGGKSLSKAYLDQIEPFASVSIGLALRSAGDL